MLNCSGTEQVIRRDVVADESRAASNIAGRQEASSSGASINNTSQPSTSTRPTGPPTTLHRGETNILDLGSNPGRNIKRRYGKGKAGDIARDLIQTTQRTQGDLDAARQKIVDLQNQITTLKDTAASNQQLQQAADDAYADMLDEDGNWSFVYTPTTVERSTYRNWWGIVTICVMVACMAIMMVVATSLLLHIVFTKQGRVALNKQPMILVGIFAIYAAVISIGFKLRLVRLRSKRTYASYAEATKYVRHRFRYVRNLDDNDMDLRPDAMKVFNQRFSDLQLHQPRCAFVSYTLEDYAGDVVEATDGGAIFTHPTEDVNREILISFELLVQLTSPTNISLVSDSATTFSRLCTSAGRTFNINLNRYLCLENGSFIVQNTCFVAGFMAKQALVDNSNGLPFLMATEY